jgi:hypothetical protein
MSFVCYQQPSGALAVLTPVPTEEITLQEVIDKAIPAGTNYKIVDHVDFIDGEYFEAYKFDHNEGAVIDIDQAKQIHLNKWREARKPLLADLDIAYSRADEVGDLAKKAEIATCKQALRDVTKIPLPDTLSEIKAIWPDILA